MIIKELDWRDYGGKHYESIFTRFYQGYILVEKFGIDKRKAHLSSLIASEQINRNEALKSLSQPPYPNNELLSSDIEFVLKKLNLTHKEFETLMSMDRVQHSEFDVDKGLISKYVKAFK